VILSAVGWNSKQFDQADAVCNGDHGFAVSLVAIHKMAFRMSVEELGQKP
jgi:hypothetical protein